MRDEPKMYDNACAEESLICEPVFMEVFCEIH